MEIKVLGPGCPNCKTLEKRIRKVVEHNGIQATIVKVDNILEIMKYDIVSTPALVINGTIVVAGRIPTEEEIKELITKNTTANE